MGNEIILTMRAVFETFARSLVNFLPRALAASALLIAGWLLASLLRLVTRRLLGWLKFDRLLERMDAGQTLRQVNLSPQRLVGSTIYWLTWAAVATAAVETLGIAGAEPLLADFVRFLPHVLAAVAVLVIGFLLSSLAWRAAMLAAVNAGLRSAKLVGALARGLVLVATAAMSLEQLGLGRGVMLAAFAITFGAVMLALAIAFGLGGRHAARRVLEERILGTERHHEDTEPHL
jgi:hypothetical protein